LFIAKVKYTFSVLVILDRIIIYLCSDLFGTERNAVEKTESPFD